VTRRVVVVPLTAPTWTPPGLDPRAWRRALADDAVDLLATLAEVEPALAVETSDRDFAAAVAWPGMRVYALAQPTVASVLEAAAADGFEQAAIIAADAPDLPGMLIAKLLRPLTTRDAAAAPAAGDPTGLLGLALTAGRPGFAAVDVYDDEPIFNADHPLLKLDNAICTPHLGFVTAETYEIHYGLAVEQILAYVAGAPIHVVNPEVLQRA